jgi:molecular chaperone Hsp33
MVLLSTASDDELADPSLAPDTVLFRLFHETGVRVFDPLRLAPGCSCDESRVEAMLERFPAEDLLEMRLPDGSVEVTCQFCSSLYRFDPDRIAGMLESRRH